MWPEENGYDHSETGALWRQKEYGHSETGALWRENEYGHSEIRALWRKVSHISAQSAEIAKR